MNTRHSYIRPPPQQIQSPNYQQQDLIPATYPSLHEKQSQSHIFYQI